MKNTSQLPLFHPIAYHKEIHLIVGFRDVDRHGGMHDPRGSAARPPLPTSTSTSRRMRCRRWPRDGATIPTPRLYCGRDTRVALLGVVNSGHLRCAWSRQGIWTEMRVASGCTAATSPSLTTR